MAAPTLRMLCQETSGQPQDASASNNDGTWIGTGVGTSADYTQNDGPGGSLTKCFGDTFRSDPSLDAHIALGTEVVIPAASDGTVECFVKVPAGGFGANQFLDGSDGSLLMVSKISGDVLVSSAGYYSYMYGVFPTDGAWHHLAVVFAGSDIALKVDGEGVGTSTRGANDFTITSLIRHAEGASESCAYYVYNETRTEGQIAADALEGGIGGSAQSVVPLLVTQRRMRS